MKNLVMGLAAHYDTDALRNFVLSFRRHMACDILLFTQELHEETLAWLKDNDVLTIALSQEALVPHNSRFLAFRAFLARNTDYGHVFLTDVRDVIAQGDIFERLNAAGGMHIFLEEKAKNIGSCPWNSAWVAEGYGPDIVGAYGDQYISCVGTLYGDKESMQLYLDMLVKELHAPCPDGRLRVEVYGMDTAAHLHLYYSGRLKAGLRERGLTLHVHENAGPVFTVGYVPIFLMSNTGLIMSIEQDFPSVVHQYDRHPAVTAAIDALYRPKPEKQ